MPLAVVLLSICALAASAGAIGYLYFGLNLSQAGMLASASLAALAVYNFVSVRFGLRSAVGAQLGDLSSAATDLGRQVAEMGRRLEALETKVDNALDQTRAVTDPLTLELAELGSLLKGLAETVTAHQSLIDALGSSAARPQHWSATVAEAAAVTAGSNGSAASTDGVPTLSVAEIRDAIEASRIDLYLQPIVGLPQRKVRFYEAMARLRSKSGEIFTGADFVAEAERGNLMSKVDYFVGFRCVAIVRRLLLKSRDIGVFCNISSSTLSDEAAFSRLLAFMDANRAIASSLVFEFTQDAVRTLGRGEQDALAQLASRGYRFSMDNVTDLRLEPSELASRGFRFVKVRATRLLQGGPGISGETVPLGLCDVLGRFSIELIADRIENETEVIDLLDQDVRYGQGFLFSPPRPVRAEALQPEEKGEQAPTAIKSNEQNDEAYLSLNA